jgi:two-component system, OmpR family, phosphate regulon sensor histidine kinase PhoR
MKKPTSLAWRLFFSYILIVFATLIAAGWYFISSLEDFLQTEVVDGLTAQTRLVQQQINPFLQPLVPDAIDTICKRSGSDTGVRYTVVLPSGVVVGDTSENPDKMESHFNRPEVAGALTKGFEFARRYSTTLQRNEIYVASALRMGEQPIAVVRAAIPLSQIEKELFRVRSRFIGIGVVLAALGLIVTLATSKRYGQKIRHLQEGSARLAEGDLSHRIKAPDSEELAGIAESLNRMAGQLQSRMQEVISQRNQLEAVLASMQEGVVAVDHEGRVISVNPAAARWFDLHIDRVMGRSLQEVIRNHFIQKFVDRSLKTVSPAEEDMTVFHKGERILNVKSTPLHGMGAATFGTLIVFNDVTQLRQLERMRQDFVANVSHELRTPLTAIKGFVEILHHGQVEPEEAQRFLLIIEKHANRLSMIINDLLMLSRIEDQAEHNEIKRGPVRINDLIENAVQICHKPADEMGIVIQVSGEKALIASVDPVLLEQAVVNLVDNAVKYSGTNSTVEITTKTTDQGIQIIVQDQGVGIEKKHLSRIFERFYRVDKARSRAAGGTGLGLAIVKHIAQAHGGHVSVESTVGEGSRFTIYIPRDSRA